MADRTNPAGEKWKKGRKKKRPLPGTPAQALNEAAGVKTAGTGNPGDRRRGGNPAKTLPRFSGKNGAGHICQRLPEKDGRGKTSRLRKEQATGTCTAAAPLEQEETCTLRKEKVPVENGTTPRT